MQSINAKDAAMRPITANFWPFTERHRFMGKLRARPKEQILPNEEIFRKSIHSFISQTFELLGLKFDKILGGIPRIK